MATNTKSVCCDIQALNWRRNRNDLAASVPRFTAVDLVNEDLLFDGHAEVVRALLVMEETRRAECNASFCVRNLSDGARQN